MVICPTCKTGRPLTFGHAKRIAEGKHSATCSFCLKKEAEELQRQARKIQLIRDRRAGIAPCDRLIYEAHGRCKEYERCIHYEDCLDFAADHDWKGWKV